MNSTEPGLMRPALYVVGTPIGNLADFSLRAQQVLGDVDYILAEDTRKSQHLLERYNIKNSLVAYHDHVETMRSETIINEMKKKSAAVALISDSGTPLISDPGFKLVKKGIENSIPIIPIPGPSALVACISISNLPIDKFVFEGFLSSKQGSRLRRLNELKNEERSIVFYEAPHRIVEFLGAVEKVMGSGRQVIVARELTKIHETVYRGEVSGVRSTIMGCSNNRKGEFTIILEGAAGYRTELEKQVDAWLTMLLEELDLKTAVKMVCKMTNSKRNSIYDRALRLLEKNTFEKKSNKKQNKS